MRRSSDDDAGPSGMETGQSSGQASGQDSPGGGQASAATRFDPRTYGLYVDVDPYTFDHVYQYPPGYYNKNVGFQTTGIPVERRETITFHFMQVATGYEALQQVQPPYDKTVSKPQEGELNIIHPCLKEFSDSEEWRKKRFDKHMAKQPAMTQLQYEQYMKDTYKKFCIDTLADRVKARLVAKYATEGKNIQSADFGNRIQVTFGELEDALKEELPGQYPRFQTASVNNARREKVDMFNQLVLTMDRRFKGSETTKANKVVKVNATNRNNPILL